MVIGNIGEYKTEVLLNSAIAVRSHEKFDFSKVLLSFTAPDTPSV